MTQPAPEVPPAEALPPLHGITTLAALRAVSDDQRQRILTLLILEPRGARDLASQLRMSRPKVYYHLNLLEQHGLIRVVAQRVRGRQVERVYRAVARAFRVESSLLGGRARRGAMSARAQIFRNAVKDFEEVGEFSPEQSQLTLVSRVLLRLRPAQVAELRRRLVAILDDLDTTQQDGEPTELVMALFPTERS
ncbi:MAG: ArsR/SmtB family transcription factor [Myxococcaceae bacterium]